MINQLIIDPGFHLVYLISFLQAQRRYFLFVIQISSNLLRTQSLFQALGLYYWLQSPKPFLYQTPESGSYTFRLELAYFKRRTRPVRDNQ